MFEKSLQDLVKGIRSHKRDPSAFISQSIQEIKQELRNVDPFVKAQAVRKLTYLQMMGYDMSWASFSVVEVMSSPRFAHKRIGYLAACQTFTDTTDVILLTTNLLKKEFQSPNQYEVGLAVNCLANIVTKDLARDLIGDIVSLIAHSKPYVRKKSVLSLYKMYIKYPQGLRLTFDKLKEKLEDAESAVVSCAVNVICELAHKNPKNYLALAPKFFRLLTTSSNNWMLIKVVKLLGSLVPEEPRLARKLLEPLATIIQNTAAKSLLYECIHTVTLALPFARKPDGSDGRNLQAVVTLCSDHLRQFVEDPDQNLKYLGLVGFVNLMKSYPKAVVDHKELVLQCLSDDDVTIRMKALELLTGMVTKRNLTELVHKLMQHVLLAEGQYRDEIIQKIIFMCSRDKYAYLSDVAWYVSVLVDLSYVQGPIHGPLVASQLIDVTVRAEGVRDYAVKCMLGLLLDSNLFMGQSQTTISNVLYAAGWIIGEYADHLPGQHVEVGGGKSHDVEGHDGDDELGAGGGINGGQSIFTQVLSAYLDPRTTNLPEDVQIVYMQNALKVLAAASRHLKDDIELERILALLKERLLIFMQSVHVEVQERATTFRNLLVSCSVFLLDKSKDGGDKEEKAEEPLNLLMASVPDGSAVVSAARLNQPLLEALFAEQLQPVNPKAQKKVPVPEGLALDVPIDASSFENLKSYAGGFPKNPDLAQVCFTQIYMAPDPNEDTIEMIFSGLAGGTPHRRAGYEEAGGDSPLVGGDHQHDEASRRAQWQATPFYLPPGGGGGGALGGGGGAAAGIDETDIDNIPIIRLTPEDLEGKARRRGAGKRRNKKDRHTSSRYLSFSSSGSLLPAHVMKDEMMPEGALDSGGEESEKAKDKANKGARGLEVTDLKDIDITTPLQPDEVMPRMEHRAAVSKASITTNGKGPSSPAPPDYGEKKRRSKSSKSGGTTSRKLSSSTSKNHTSSSRSKAGGGGGSGGGTSEALLIDLDDFGTPQREGGGRPAASRASPDIRKGSLDTRQLKEDAMDLLHFGDNSPIRQATSEGGGGGGAISSSSRFSSAESRLKEKSGSVDILGLEGSPTRMMASSKERSGSRTMTSGARKRSSSAKAASTSNGVNSLMFEGGEGPSSSSAAAGKKPSSSREEALTSFRSLRFPLLKSSGIKVEYSLSIEALKHQATVYLRIKNASKHPISDVCLDVQELLPRVSIVGGGGAGAGAINLASAVGVGESVKAPPLTFKLPEMVGLIAVPVQITFISGDSMGTGCLLETPTEAAGQLHFFLAGFLQPGSLSSSRFMSLLGGSEVQWHESSVRLPWRRSFDAVVDRLMTFFRAQLMEKTPSAAAALYSKTSNQDHVAILAKFMEGEVSVSIKSNQPRIAQNLVAEVRHASLS